MGFFEKNFSLNPYENVLAIMCYTDSPFFEREKKQQCYCNILLGVQNTMLVPAFFLFYVYINHYFFLRHSRNPFFKMIPADRMPFVYKSLRFIDNVTLKMTIDYSFPILLFTYFQAKIQNEMVFCCTYATFSFFLMPTNFQYY